VRRVGRPEHWSPRQVSEGAHEVILEPQNLRRDELDELAQALRRIEPAFAVRFAEERAQRGYAVTWWEVLYIWLPATAMAAAATAGPAVIKKLVDLAIDWARTRFARQPGNRPKYVAIYGPDGKLIRSVLITGETAEPEDQTASDREKPPRRRPSVRDD
jgi:hypothetical protein